MNGHWIDIPTADAGAYSGYLSQPPAGKGPGIVLIQEIWGVNAHIRAVADQYASAGYVVLAPDVFWRLAPRVNLNYDEAGNAKAFELYGKVDATQAAFDVADAVAALRNLAECSGRVATLGYCFGGQLAFRAAALSKTEAAVCFYGGGIEQHLDVADQVTQPILFHYGSQDSHITPDKVAAVKTAFVNKTNASFFDYPEAGHGFNCWGRKDAYNQRAAALAQGRTLIFLAENL